MITLLTLSILCVVGVALVSVVLLVKGLLDRPFRWENLIPAGAALLCAGLLKWLF